MSLKTRLIRPGLDVLYYSGMGHLLGRPCRGVGAIFMLHHVCPAGRDAPFSPNRILEVSPEFLERILEWLRTNNCDIVSLDEAQRRLRARDFRRRFVCFTLDDGYADCYRYAFPVFRRYRAPFAVYVQSGLLDGTAVLWWRLLEQVVRDHDAIEVHVGGREYRFATRSARQKSRAFERLYWPFRSLPAAHQAAAVETMAVRYRLDPQTLCRTAALTWDMLTEMAESGLVTVGAHTVSHSALARLPLEEARHEIEHSRAIVAQRLGQSVRHFCYPFGDPSAAGPREFQIVRQLGFSTATTTRKGLLFPEHVDHLHALPRIPLNGAAYERMRYVELYLSGAPVALWRGFRRLDVN